MKFIAAFALLLSGLTPQFKIQNSEFKIQSPSADPGTLTLPSGFKASSIIETLGANRHIWVNTNGDIFVKLEKLKDGKGIVVLRDVKKDGVYAIVQSFCNYTGTGIVIKNGYLYATSDFAVYRYKLNAAGLVANPDKPETIVKDLVSLNQHASKSIALDDAGNLYVTIGAPSNACQVKDRTAGSLGQDPCPILEKAGGVWQFKANLPNQSYKNGVRYITGIRNVVGVFWNKEQGQLYGVQHGRDQLAGLFPKLYTNEQSAELPAEEFFLMKKGSDFGWPYCYYDQMQKKKVLGPEYGGDVQHRVVVRTRTSPSWHSPDTGHRMICYFIPAISSLRNIRTVPSLLSMDHGIVDLYRNKDTMWSSFLLRMVNLPVLMKFLHQALPAKM
jgi:glucose/arabinose dehydrogenase